MKIWKNYYFHSFKRSRLLNPCSSESSRRIRTLYNRNYAGNFHEFLLLSFYVLWRNRYSYCTNNPLKFTDPSGYQKYQLDQNYYNRNSSGTPSTDWWRDYQELKKNGHNVTVTDYLDNLFKNNGIYVWYERVEDTSSGSVKKGHDSKGNMTGEITGVKIIYKRRVYSPSGQEGVTTKEWGTNEYVGVTSMLMGAIGNQIGSHMSSVSRFAAIKTLDGRVVAQATSQYRFGPIPGATATKLGAGLRIGGNLLGGFGIGYTGYQMVFNGAPLGKGFVDIGFGVVGFLGPIGLGISAIYFVGDTFIPGGWQAVPQHQYNEIQMNSIDGVWLGAHNHFK